MSVALEVAQRMGRFDVLVDGRTVLSRKLMQRILGRPWPDADQVVQVVRQARAGGGSSTSSP